MVYSLLLISFVLFTVTFVFLKIFIAKAEVLGLLDIPNSRSSHNKAIPRGAGIVFGIVFLVAIFLLNYFILEENTYTYIFISLVIVFFTGVYDDFKNISSRKKFLFIIAATILAYYDGFAIETLGNYFGYELSLGYAALAFTVFAVVGFTNAINLTDGLDGLAGSISIIILSSLVYIGFINADVILVYASIFLIVPLLAFLWFNWYPARVFMGDSGSLFLGFTIAILSIYALKYVNPASILFLAAIPLLDTLIVIRRRRQRNQSLFVADKNHLHHMLLGFKKDKLFTVVSLVKLQILFSLIFVQVYDKSNFINLVLFILLFSIFFTLFDPRISHRQKRKTTRNIKNLQQKAKYDD